MSRVFVFNAKDDVFVTEGILSEDIINGEALVDKLQELGMNYLSAKEWALSPEGKEYIGNVIAMHKEKLKSKFDPYTNYKLSIIDDNKLSMSELGTLIHNCIYTCEVK